MTITCPTTDSSKSTARLSRHVWLACPGHRRRGRGKAVLAKLPTDRNMRVDLYTCAIVEPLSREELCGVSLHDGGKGRRGATPLYMQETMNNLPRRRYGRQPGRVPLAIHAPFPPGLPVAGAGRLPRSRSHPGMQMGWDPGRPPPATTNNCLCFLSSPSPWHVHLGEKNKTRPYVEWRPGKEAAAGFPRVKGVCNPRHHDLRAGVQSEREKFASIRQGEGHPTGKLKGRRGEE